MQSAPVKHSELTYRGVERQRFSLPLSEATTHSDLLADHAREVLVAFQVRFWPFVVTGLLVIHSFWSRSLIYTLTVISA
jgi:hypothetical protein